MVTTDLEIAKQVLIKDFNKFHSRQVSTAINLHFVCSRLHLQRKRKIKH